MGQNSRDSICSRDSVTLHISVAIALGALSMINKTGWGIALVLACLMSPLSLLAQAQLKGPHYKNGIVYYADNGNFKSFNKEVASVGHGWSKYTVKVQGAHATVRLPADQPQIFLVCGVNPSHLKLYRVQSEKDARTLDMAKIRWMADPKDTLSESEIPVSTQSAESGCFKITPEKPLEAGEFSFSPTDNNDCFMFGVGDVKQSN